MSEPSDIPKQPQALVTGATSGIGRETVRRLVAEGWQVIGTGRDQQRLDDLEHELGEAFIGHAADLSKAPAPDELMAFVQARFGTLDLLVNNAGCSWVGNVADMPTESIDTVLDVNLRSLILLCRNAVPLLTGSPGAQIVNIGSVAAHLRADQISVYSATKAAVIAFGHALAKELAPQHIRVNTLSPTGTDTEVFERVGVEIDRNALVPAAEIAELILLLTRLPDSVDVGELLVAKRFTPGC